MKIYFPHLHADNMLDALCQNIQNIPSTGTPINEQITSSRMSYTLYDEYENSVIWKFPFAKSLNVINYEIYHFNDV